MYLEVSAFNGRDDITKIQFNRDGQPVDFTAEGVTKIEAVAASKVVPAEYTGNVVSVKFGKLGIMPGIYMARIVIYTSTAPDGLVIAGPGKEVEIELSYNA
ncbi:MAG: hypothetical protein CVV11_19765 [Gammaproteobacteria bacterium HGW-Gammaproteobacteria-15]|nr:MAG: hypothetical protein CVV11_19765 [Gammaproteobacteria bacterium HGW-Gammaproteobacteria-15]